MWGNKQVFRCCLAHVEICEAVGREVDVKVMSLLLCAPDVIQRIEGVEARERARWERGDAVVIENKKGDRNYNKKGGDVVETESLSRCCWRRRQMG